MGNAECKGKVVRFATLTLTFRIPNSAFRISNIPESAMARPRAAPRPARRLRGRRENATGGLQPPRPRSVDAARAPLRAAPPRRRRALARHGLPGGVRPAALGAREPAGGRLVRRSCDDLRAR